MVYVGTEIRGDELVLTRHPQLRSFVVALGCFMLGLWLFLRWPDEALWRQCVALIGFVTLGVFCIEDTQECSVKKSNDRLTTRRYGLFSRTFGLQTPVKVFSCAVTDITVVGERLRYFADGHLIRLDLEDGSDVLVTETCTLGPRAEHEAVADEICRFLGLNPETNVSIEAVPEKSRKQHKD
eukprot:m.260037 g.260037  ORF g.260037 m.260037 type:complete len:182 (-) comp19672_c1_seq4:340-885(-)